MRPLNIRYVDDEDSNYDSSSKPDVNQSEDTNFQDDNDVLDGEYVQDDNTWTYLFKTRIGILELVSYFPRVPKSVYEGYRDFTYEELEQVEADFKVGFKPANADFLAKYDIPANSQEYRTPSGLSNVLSISLAAVNKMTKTMLAKELYPHDLIRDQFGYTPYGVAIFRTLTWYTFKRKSANGMDKEFWKQLKIQHQDYLNLGKWFSEYKNRLALQQPLYTNDPDEIYLTQRMDTFQRQIEICKAEAMQYFLQELEQLKHDKIKVARAKGIEDRKEVLDVYHQAYVQGASEGQTEEDDDFWNDDTQPEQENYQQDEEEYHDESETTGTSRFYRAPTID